MIHMLSGMRLKGLKVLVSEAEGEGVGKNDNNVKDQFDERIAPFSNQHLINTF